MNEVDMNEVDMNEVDMNEVDMNEVDMNVEAAAAAAINLTNLSSPKYSRTEWITKR
jgi:hypothetical protein